MDISKLEVGMVVKNYKEMCALLDEKVLSGKSKKKRDEWWRKFFDFEIDGYKLIVKEIYDENAITLLPADVAEKLLLELLIDENNKNTDSKVVLTKKQILEYLCIINQNYYKCKRRIPKLSQFINVEVNNVYEFYEFADDAIERYLLKAIKGLNSKKLISGWSSTYRMVCIVEAIPVNNIVGKIRAKKTDGGLDKNGEKVYKYESNNKTNLNFRKATYEEDQMIIQTEYEVIHEMGFKDQVEVIRHGEYDDYKTAVAERLMNKANIDFYYYAYEFTNNEKYIVEGYERLDALLTEKYRDTVNKDIIDKLDKNAYKRYIKVQKENDFLLNTEKEKRRNSKQYLIDNKTMSQNLIEIDATNIVSDVITVKLNKTKG